MRLPVHLCTARDTLTALQARGLHDSLERAGVHFVVDTCVVGAPILDAAGGVMMTNSAKFAHYGPANTGYASVFGSLADCVETAVAGRLVRDEGLWQLVRVHGYWWAVKPRDLCCGCMSRSASGAASIRPRV